MRDRVHSGLGREIAALVVIKLLALAALWAVFFSDPAPSGPAPTANALLGAPPPPAPTRSPR